MKRTDLLQAESRGSVQQAMNVAKNAGSLRLPFLQEYFTELWRLCEAYKYDFAILVAQSANETNYWRSNPGWTHYGNPAGIGITGVTGGAAGPNVSLVYKNGVDAARAQVVHMWAYTQGRIPEDVYLHNYIPLDPRYEAVFVHTVDGKPAAAAVKTLDDFNKNGMWATVAKKPWYGDRIITEGNAIWPGLEQGDGTEPPPVVVPPTPGVGWRPLFNIMFGNSWRITQEWKNDPPGPIYDDMYEYAAGHGTAEDPLDGDQHPGIDVGIPYGTTLRAPARAKVMCAGTNVGPGIKGAGCSAFNDWGDGDGTGAKKGVGRIELYFEEKKQSLIYGHSRTCKVKPGDYVEAGQIIGTSGGMLGAHCHLEARDFNTSRLLIVNPKIVLNGLDVVTPQPPGTTDPLPSTGELVFGRVPRPDIVDRQARMKNKPEGVGWDNLGKRDPKFIALHRIIGYLWGTDEYFARADTAALTDFGIGVSAFDGPSNAGTILQWNDYFGYRSGWASGRVSAPYGDGKRIVDKYGINAVNKDGISVEISGNYDTPIDDVAWKKLVHLCAWIADSILKVPYHSKIVPSTGIALLIWHQEFTIGTGKICPGDVVMQLTNRLYRDIAAFNQPYQTGAISPPVEPGPEPEPEPVEPPPSEYAEPLPIPELAALADIEKDDLAAIVTAEGEKFIVVSDWVKAIRTTPRRQSGDGNAPSIGPDIKKGTEFAVRWMFDDGEGREWYITDWWSRILVEDTKRLSDTIPKAG